MNRNVLETVIGAIVLSVAVIFVVFAYSAAQLKSVDGYLIHAAFNRIDGIRPGGDVRISGIKVGTVTSAVLDPKTFQADVTLSVDNSIRLPEDSVAQVSSSGLLGDKFMELIPGASDTFVKPGGTLHYTQSPTSLESLLGQAVFSMSHPQQGTAAAPASPSPAPPSNPAPASSAAPAKP